MKSMDKRCKDEEEAIKLLVCSLEESVRKSCEGKKKVAVAFSGGIDSSFIAFLAKKYSDVVLIVVGLEQCKDFENAEKSSKILNLPLERVVLTEEEVIELSYQINKILGDVELMQIELGLIIYKVSEKAKKLKIKHLLSGQGSDELFLGYYKNLDRNEREIDSNYKISVEKVQKYDFERDKKICSTNSVEIIMPFLEKRVIETAANIHPCLKIKDKERKYILRKAAEKIGLPYEICWIEKKAMQYGSSVHKTLLKNCYKHKNLQNK